MNKVHFSQFFNILLTKFPNVKCITAVNDIYILLSISRTSGRLRFEIYEEFNSISTIKILSLST